MKFTNLHKRIRQTLVEDDAFSDVTTQQIPRFRDRVLRAKIVAGGTGVFCGGFLLKVVFGQLDPLIKMNMLKREGSMVHSGDVVAQLRGTARALLGGERTCLNLVCQLSGIASLTRKWAPGLP